MSGWRYHIQRMGQEYIVTDDHWKEETFRGTYLQCLIFLGCMCERMTKAHARKYIKGLPLHD